MVTYHKTKNAFKLLPCYCRATLYLQNDPLCALNRANSEKKARSSATFLSIQSGDSQDHISLITNSFLTISHSSSTEASPGFGARRSTCKSYWVFTWGNCRHIVAVRLCTGQSALKKWIVVSRGGHVPQCPIAGDANDRLVQFKH